MNYHKACIILNIDSTQKITMEIIKKHYRHQALKNHPDKNKSEDAVEKFQLINESFEFLKKYILFYGGFTEEEDYPLEEEGEDDYEKNYQTLLFVFIRNMLENDTCKSILIKISSLCEEKAVEYLEKMDVPILQKILEFVLLYYDVLHFSDKMIENIQLIIREKKYNNKVHRKIISCSLNDLFENNIYKLIFEGETFLVPVWHHELIYDLSGGGELYVICFPNIDDDPSLGKKSEENKKKGQTLSSSEFLRSMEASCREGIDRINDAKSGLVQCEPSASLVGTDAKSFLQKKTVIRIDIDNNIFINVYQDIRNILESKGFIIDLGSKSWNIPSHQIQLTKEQDIILKGQGISKPDSNDIYNIELKSDIIIHLNLF